MDKETDDGDGNGGLEEKDLTKGIKRLISTLPLVIYQYLTSKLFAPAFPPLFSMMEGPGPASSSSSMLGWLGKVVMIRSKLYKSVESPL